MTEASVEAAAQNIFDALSRVGFEGADVLIADELAAYRAAVERAAALKLIAAKDELTSEQDAPWLAANIIDPDGGHLDGPAPSAGAA